MVQSDLPIVAIFGQSQCWTFKRIALYRHEQVRIPRAPSSTKITQMMFTWIVPIYLLSDHPWEVNYFSRNLWRKPEFDHVLWAAHHSHMPVPLSFLRVVLSVTQRNRNWRSLERSVKRQIGSRDNFNLLVNWRWQISQFTLTTHSTEKMEWVLMVSR